MFKKHVYNVQHQYIQYKYCLENLKDNEVLIHIDFSENWTTKHWEEVQAMHFGASKTQVTLHTGVYYTKNTSAASFCTISPDNQHNPEAIWAHLEPILNEIRSTHPNIDQIHFFSDGPTTQYRQKKNFYLFSKNVYKLGFTYGTWNFFEASHGKGAADGIGGAVKRALDAKVAHGQDIPNAEKVFEVLTASESTIKFFFIPAAKIEILIPDTDTKITPMKNTMKVHQLITEKIWNLKHRELSCFCQNLQGRCDCHSPDMHSFEQTKFNTKTNNEDYILDEISGEIRLNNFEGPRLEDVSEDIILQQCIAVLDEQNLTDHSIQNVEMIENYDSTHEEIRAQHYKKQLQNVKKVLYEDSEEEDEEYSIHDSSHGSNFLEETLQDSSIDILTDTEDNDKIEVLEEHEVEIDSYVVVKFNLEKRIKYYIGQVTEINANNSYKVKFFRNKGRHKFALPNIDDISIVFKHDIEKILPGPIFERRGIKTFDLSNIHFKIE